MTKTLDKALYQKITDICFENGGVTKPMADKLYELFKQAEIAARIDELNRVVTHRHYGKDYQESIEALDDYKNIRINELTAQQKGMK